MNREDDSANENNDIYLFKEDDSCIENQEHNERVNSPEENDIYVFDEDSEEYDEEIKYAGHKQIRLTPPDKTYSELEYQEKCKHLGAMITFTNINSITKGAIKSQKSYFQEKKQNIDKIDRQLLVNKDKLKQPLDLKPTVLNISFVQNSKKTDNFIKENSHQPSYLQKNRKQDKIVENFDPNEVMHDNVISQNQEKLMRGAKIEKKEELKVEEIKEKNVLKVSNLRKFLFTQLDSSYEICVVIKKIESGFINTKYKVFFKENDKFLFTIEKQGFTNYLFSISEIHCSDDHISYLGKMEANLAGTQFMVFDDGAEPGVTKMLQKCKKQLAYINYSKEKDCPRKFQIFMTTNNNSSTNFTIKDKSSSNIIKQKWVKKERKNLCLLANKEPTYDSNEGKYTMNFEGLAGVASVKNFIISSKQYPDCLVFGRQDKDSYGMKVKAPFSLFQAAAICMSSIHYKFL